jgi:O-antigen ligase
MSANELVLGPMTSANSTYAAVTPVQALQADAVTRALATALLSIILFSVIAFPSVWPGRVAPLYLLAVGLAGLVVMTSQVLLNAIVGVVQRLAVPILLPWVLFILVSAQLSAYHGTFAEVAGRGVLLPLATMILFVMCAALAVVVRPRDLIAILGCIAILEGVVALLQFSGFDWAWRLPVTLVSALGGDPGDPYAVSGVRSFEDLGRVRGTLLFVHKFNPVQGALAAILISILLLGRARTRAAAMVMPRPTPFVIAAALIAVLGMVLAFSRSTILGLGVAILLVMWREFRVRTLMIAILGLAVVIVGGQLLDLGEARQYGRLFTVGGSDLNDVVRFQQYSHALETFAASPLIGQSAEQQGQETLIFSLIHSVPLRLLADFGLLGFTPYLLVVFGIGRVFWAGAKVPEARGMAMIGLAVFIVLMLDSATHSSGLLRADEAQPAFYGVLIGSVLAALPLRRRVRRAPQNMLANFKFGR